MTKESGCNEEINLLDFKHITALWLGESCKSCKSCCYNWLKFYNFLGQIYTINELNTILTSGNDGK